VSATTSPTTRNRKAEEMAKKMKRANERLKQGNFTVPSPAEVKATESGAGGWTAMQLAEWGVRWPPPKGWRKELQHRYESGIRATTEIVQRSDSPPLKYSHHENLGVIFASC
jgi:hypothetical protein